MGFWRIFFGAFHSPEIYRHARHDMGGWGIRYTLQLFFLITPLAVATIIVGHGELPFTHAENIWSDLLALAIIFGVALILRLVMLLVLAILAQLLALWLKPRLSYAASFRLAAIAYTPVALADALSFTLSGVALHPAILLGCSALMLLAALRATQ